MPAALVKLTAPSEVMSPNAPIVNPVPPLSVTVPPFASASVLIVFVTLIELAVVAEKLRPADTAPRVNAVLLLTLTSNAPVLVSVTAPTKLLVPAPSSVIAALPVVTLVVSPIVRTEPAPCVTAPPATIVRVPPLVLMTLSIVTDPPAFNATLNEPVVEEIL